MPPQEKEIQEELDLETGYYWCQIGNDTEKWIIWYDSIRKCFYRGNMLFYSDEVKVISPRIEEP